MIEADVKDVSQIIAEMTKILQQAPSIEIEYIEIVNAETLEDIEHISGKFLVAIAAKIGPARLIDNILVDSSE
jgi:pantoate--beta-alanine ligase